MTRLKPSYIALALLLCFAGVKAAAAAADAHSKEDQAKHSHMAAAHEEAARCVSAGTPPQSCAARLTEECKGIAIGPHCGLRSSAAEAPDLARRAANHRSMASTHRNAAACLAAGRSHGECTKALTKDCGGLGIGKYCGMRHSH